MTADILLITVNDHEDRELKAELEAQNVTGIEEQGPTLSHYTNYGQINGQTVILANSLIGSTTSGSSFDTVRNAIKDYSPSIVICVGIAWGGKEDEQSIGDLLISTEIQIGANKKISDDGTNFRAERPSTSRTALRTLENSARAKNIKFHRGVLLSEETLFDNKAIRDESLAACSAIGGEMEALGAHKAVQQASEEQGKHIQLLVAKSICDWGYEKNVSSQQKEVDQKKAANNAAIVVVHALKNFKLVKNGVNTGKSDTEKLKSGESQASGTLKELLNGVGNSLDFEVINDGCIPHGSIIYWPVRLRRPNIVHAAQTYVAAHLQAKGLNVKLCLDDLGKVAGYSSSQEGAKDFKKRVIGWAKKVGSEEHAAKIIDNSILFSDFIKDPDTEENEKVMALLGQNLVKWLMRSEQLRSVLKDTKLIEGDTPLLDRRPRKLLSPSVVWTVMECIIREQGVTTNIGTLGGHDEYAIWDACPQKNKISIQSILLPKVKGTMDTTELRPETQQRLQENLDTHCEMLEWVQNYLVRFPALVNGDHDAAHKDWQNESNRKLANAAFEYYQ
ncbi:hypothetical protein N9850_07810 [Granulosicoccus sp.]|nr:hypothetical protein [Granulosicoccus sp.]MDB4223666.1 hypothetical protein [Granulosicoccus sp.]